MSGFFLPSANTKTAQDNIEGRGKRSEKYAGGWIMLSVVLVGITLLITTHILGRHKRTESQGLPQLMYRELRHHRAGRWV